MAEEIDGTLSLYFALKDDRLADLEVVAEAALHWASTLRSAARAIDPSIELRLELVDAEQGSLRINTVLDWVENGLKRTEDGGVKHLRVKKLAIATAAFVVISGVPTYQYYFAPSKTVDLSEEDRARLDALIKQTASDPSVSDSRSKMFRALAKDRAIEGVGVSEERGVRPNNLIPAREFPGRSGLWTAPEEPTERTVYPVLDVTLISPALVEKPRAWRFKPQGLPEFTAMMRDPRFLEALKSDHVKERLRIGIPMTIRMKVQETNRGGIWMVKRGGRAVVEVLSPKVD